MEKVIVSFSNIITYIRDKNTDVDDKTAVDVFKKQINTSEKIENKICVFSRKHDFSTNLKTYSVDVLSSDVESIIEYLKNIYTREFCLVLNKRNINVIVYYDDFDLHATFNNSDIGYTHLVFKEMLENTCINDLDNIINKMKRTFLTIEDVNDKTRSLRRFFAND